MRRAMEIANMKRVRHVTHGRAIRQKLVLDVMTCGNE